MSDETRRSPQRGGFEDHRSKSPVQRILDQAASPHAFHFSQNKNVAQRVVQRVSTINSKDLTNGNIAFANSFKNYHWAESEDDAKHYSLARMDEGFRGQINTVIEGSLADIKGYIKGADFELEGAENEYVTFTVKVKHWQVSTLVGADENKIGSCKSYNADVSLKGYLKKSGNDVKKILVTGVDA